MATKNLSKYDTKKVPSAEKLKFAVIVSEWNTEITEGLYKGCYETLISHKAKAKNVTRIDVPGSFELVYAAAKALKTKKYDAIIVLGSVIQGETKHFDFVCDAVANGIAQLNTLAQSPVIFGLLTDNTLQQAKDRSGGKLGNKGVECAVVAIKMVKDF